jgi:uncharacterized protein DUF6894
MPLYRLKLTSQSDGPAYYFRDAEAARETAITVALALTEGSDRVDPRENRLVLLDESGQVVCEVGVLL